MRHSRVLCFVLLASLAAAGPTRAEENPLTKEQESAEVSSAQARDGAGGEARGGSEAPRDGEGVASLRDLVPQRRAGDPGRARRGDRGARQPSRLPDRRLRLRRPLAHRRPRRNVDSPLRRPAHVDHRLLRARATATARPLRRDGRVQLQPHLLRRTRDVQDDRRREDLAADRPLRHPPHRQGPGRPARLPDRVRRGGRPPLHRELRARGLRDRATAAGPGRRRSSWTTAPARSTSCRIRSLPTSSMPRRGSARAPPRTSSRAGREAACGSPPTPAAPGSASPAGSRRDRRSAASGSRSPRRSPQTLYAVVDNQARRPDSEIFDEEAPPGELTPRRLKKLDAEAFAQARRRGHQPFPAARTTSRSRSRRRGSRRTSRPGRPRSPTSSRSSRTPTATSSRTTLDRPRGLPLRRRRRDLEAHARKPHRQGLLQLTATTSAASRWTPWTPSASTSRACRCSTSTDGGKTWKGIGGRGVHGDYHAILIDPKAPQRLAIGNDGGINVSYDYGETWTKLNNLPVGQFTILAVDNAEPYNIVGGLQDNGVMRGPSTLPLRQDRSRGLEIHLRRRRKLRRHRPEGPQRRVRRPPVRHRGAVERQDRGAARASGRAPSSRRRRRRSRSATTGSRRSSSRPTRATSSTTAPTGSTAPSTAATRGARSPRT